MSGLARLRGLTLGGAACGALSVALCACALPPVAETAHGVALPAQWSLPLPAPTPTPPPEAAASSPTALAGASPASSASAPLSLQASLAQAQPSPALSLWWRAFQDPQLSALIEQAQQNNPTLQSAQASLRQALALRDAASAALWPSLSATASAQRSTAGQHSASNLFGAGLAGSWAPDLFGGNRQALAAAEASARASAATAGATQVSLAAEVAQDYLLLRSSQDRLAIAQSNLDSQQDTAQITRWREQAGLTTALESAQASSAADQTRALLPPLRKLISQTTHTLAVLCGLAPASLDAQLNPASALAASNTAQATPALAASLPRLPQPPASLSWSLPADTLRQRADVQAAEFAVLAARALVNQAEAARWPSLALEGTLGLSALSLSKLSRPAALVSSLLASASLPLLDGGAARAQVRAQSAALELAQMSWQNTVLSALKEVEDALVALQQDRERVAVLQDAARAAAQAALWARQRYGSGLADFQTVLETQRSQLSTEDGLATAQADLAADHVLLYLALGGGWQADDDSLPTSSTASNAPPASSSGFMASGAPLSTTPP